MEGTNIIGILKGSRWGKSTDTPIIIGAHLDTVPNSPGSDDNGSGLSALIEAARAISSSDCSYRNSIIFVAFDYEEVGKFT